MGGREEQPDESGTRPTYRPKHVRPLRRRRRIVGIIAGSLAGILVIAAAFVVYQYNDISNGIHRSAITLPKSSATAKGPGQLAATNILLMGLDSRLDENGNPLPAAVYNALHAGDGSDGGYNTNVLMLIHIPGGGKPAVGISIPRDDYVNIPGSPDDVSTTKIKEAYGLELDQTLRHLVNTTNLPHAAAYQQARAAARQEEISTVSQFLGGVPINHFIEVTMAAFYQIAEAVQPITVCVKEATSDPYSGAKFTAGYQQLDASQAVAFVRQRRDLNNPALNFTDLDRERRQQAFIVSLAYKLKQSGTLTNIGTLNTLIGVAKQNIALDSGFDLLSFIQQARGLAGGNISFTTLPITGYATIESGSIPCVK
ncbi:MAG: LytR family transcriptional regulator [Frondihabitans sp.]|nr:LytR family transcriptional regulator [Frondihabitans sp.]